MRPGGPVHYPDMALAHQYCVGQGIELGAAAYNSFDLPGSINVAPFADDPSQIDYVDFEFYKGEQIAWCGAYAEVDLVGEAHAIPVEDCSQDYVISSHVIEHLPNLIAAFLEWNRVLKPGGIVFMIFPKRNSLPLDASRAVTPLSHYIEDHYTGQTLYTHGFEGGHGVRGHYHVFTLGSMLELIDWCNHNLELHWKVEAVEETDSKVGNGHTVVCRYLPHEAQPEAPDYYPVPEPVLRTTQMRIRQLARTSYQIMTTQGLPAFFQRLRKWLGGERRYYRR